MSFFKKQCRRNVFVRLMKIPEKLFNYSLRITLYETNFSFSYVKNSVAMLSSCLPLNLPCDFPSTRIRVCTCLNEQYICRYCRETYYVILNRVQYACAFLCERFPLNTFSFTVMKSKLSCFIVKNIPC